MSQEPMHGSTAPRDEPEPLPQPFEEEPLRPTSGGGCGRAALIGCGVLLLLFGIAAVAFVVKAPEVMLWMMGRLESTIAEQFPEDLPADERERFHRAFDAFEARVEEGDVDPAAIQDLNRRLMDVAGELEEGLTREQVRELTEAVERAAGVEDGASPRSP